MVRPSHAGESPSLAPRTGFCETCVTSHFQRIRLAPGSEAVSWPHPDPCPGGPPPGCCPAASRSSAAPSSAPRSTESWRPHCWGLDFSSVSANTCPHPVAGTKPESPARPPPPQATSSTTPWAFATVWQGLPRPPSPGPGLCQGSCSFPGPQKPILHTAAGANLKPTPSHVALSTPVTSCPVHNQPIVLATANKDLSDVEALAPPSWHPPARAPPFYRSCEGCSHHRGSAFLFILGFHFPPFLGLSPLQ